MIDKTINFDEMEFGMFRKLSICLGITFSEVIDISPVLFPVTTSGNIIKGYIASFNPAASQKIFQKIKNLSPGYTVYIGYYFVNELLPKPETDN